jgi:hypothetical protein
MGCRRLLASSHTGPKGPFCASRHRLRGNALYQQAASVCSRAGRARPGNGGARAHVLTQMAVTKAKPALFGLVQSPISNIQQPTPKHPTPKNKCRKHIDQVATQESQSSMQTPPLKPIPEEGGSQNNNPTDSNFIEDLHPKLEPQEPDTQRQELSVLSPSC